MPRPLAALIIALTLLVLTPSNPALATDFTNGAQVFAANCAACHSGGGNIIRRGKNLKRRALGRNKMNSIKAISSLVTNGKYAMPAYKDRLSYQQIQDVAAYVLQQADNNWKS
ncbi:MAG: c-type cytochrome [Oscillatoria sp. SIO1A7]|nr:c-type cytochrome [Oscillatoria sp. SIO1A7]